MLWECRGDRGLRGSFSAPGDKSISHRALLLNALARGEAEIRGANPGADVQSTARCLRALGIAIESTAPGSFGLRGRGLQWRPATDRLDCGNSGTTVRLLAGILAGQSFTSTLDGDDSLRGRPMSRISRPLRAFGARVEGPDNGAHLPLIVTGPLRRGGVHLSEVASAQVKSALLLAALVSGQVLRVEEPSPSRNHTENLLTAMGAAVDFGPGWAEIRPSGELRAQNLAVPADPSAAAFPLAAALLLPGSEVVARRMLKNPTRWGFFDVLEGMGVVLEIGAESDRVGERVVDLGVRWTPELRAIEVKSSQVASMVDEIPLLAVLAAFAQGTSVFEGVAELRVKESDRVAGICELLEAWSIHHQVEGEVLSVVGGAPQLRTSPPVFEDHRMAMASAVLAMGAHARGPETAAVIVDLSAASISDPNFCRHFEGLRDGS